MLLLKFFLALYAFNIYCLKHAESEREGERGRERERERERECVREGVYDLIIEEFIVLS